ncbi:MBL fold metallo-hydrolase [Streptomyces sp. GC420]|uniref:MBL fold metallo-hydrolase n=1 Tax=Streptomyces sp. GC420 TaxID=2697568 RepID=UPI001DBCCB85|nr:MBL fold metallo-hydrolase [Streptomyces sp. GC420]NBM16235.1 MBL fold metallo-hydrolase [Streptomyces sp. GC420]
MPYPSRSVADVEVVPLCDAVGPMGEALARPLGELFGGPGHPVWSGPCGHAPQDGWVLHFHCFLLRDPAGRTVLVDTGVGPLDSPAASWAPVPGRLAAELAAAGTEPDEVDAVVLTHLHSDHVSGSLAADGVSPAFPNARYVVQRAELDWVARAGSPLAEAVVEPLRKAGCLDVVDGVRALAAGVETVHTPGHTPGHQSVRVGDGALLVAGDVLHHPVQLADPTAAYLYDEDRERATATRQAVLEALAASGGVLATAHFPEPFTALPGSR